MPAESLAAPTHDDDQTVKPHSNQLSCDLSFLYVSKDLQGRVNHMGTQLPVWPFELWYNKYNEKWYNEQFLVPTQV